MSDSNLRQTTVVGRVGQDAARDGQTPNVVRFGVAVNQWDPTTKTEETVWVNCSAWDKQADYALQHIKKGRRVWVTGKHSVYEGHYGPVDQLNVKSMGPADLFAAAPSEDEDEW